MRRSFATLVLAVSLVPMHHHQGFFEPLWSFFSSLWGGAKAQQGQPAPTKAGCGWDPNGRCLQTQQSQPVETDAGCGWDPNGRSCS